MTKTTIRFLIAATLLAVMATVLLLANLLPSFFFDFYPEVSRQIISFLAAITSIVPFAVCEILGLALLIVLVYTLVRAIRKSYVFRWLSGLALTVSAVAFAFVMLWGLNYYAPPLAERLSLQERQFTAEQLREAAEYYRDMANAAAKNVEREL